MCNPGGVAIDAAGDLFVADTGNNRVIEIDAPLAGTQDATRVFGQAGDFTASGCNRGARRRRRSTLCAPAGLMLDVIGNLWVADANNDRVLEYAAPFGSDSAAAMALGQGDSGQLHDRGMRPRNRNRRLVRTRRRQPVRAVGGGARCEYRSVRGGHAE